MGLRLSSTTIFLWLTVLAVIAGIYVYRVEVLVTVGIVLCVSLFLGLLVFSMIVPPIEDQQPSMDDADGNLPAAERGPEA